MIRDALHGMEPPFAFNRHAQIAFSLSRKRVFWI